MSTELQHKAGERVMAERDAGDWVKARIIDIDPEDSDLPYHIRYDHDARADTGYMHWKGTDHVRPLDEEKTTPEDKTTVGLTGDLLVLGTAVPPTGVSLVTEVECKRRVQQERNQGNGRMSEYMNLVRETAIQVAEDNEWCKQGLNETLEILSLELVATKRQVSFEVTATWTVTATTETTEEVDEDFISNSIQMSDPDMDGDWDDVNMGEPDVSVSNVEEEE